MTTEEKLDLIARVLAWQDGAAPESITAVAGSTLMQDYAQQCLEDLAEVPKPQVSDG